MKRFIALAVLAVLALTSAMASAQSTHWAEQPIQWRTINSTTTGTAKTDSVWMRKNAAGAFGTTDAAGYADTTEWFAPTFWTPKLDLNAWRTGVLNAGDTTFYMQVVLENDPQSSITASIDSVVVSVQGSWNGSTPTSSSTLTLLDATATENVQRVFFTQLNSNNPSAVTLSTMGAFPYLRFILSGDHGGRLKLTARYLTRDP